MMDQEIFGTMYQEEIYQIRQKPVVVINEDWEKLGDNERDLLSKIISALKISVDAITIITQPTLRITSFHGKTSKLIYFGELPAGVSYYEILESDGLEFICSQSLSQLIDNEPARKQLWQGLRKLFLI
jgi:DNA polymerase III psi subunit